MTNYFAQYMPNIGSSHQQPQPLINTDDDSNQGNIKYLVMFNPSLCRDKPTISNEELYKQVLMVVPSDNDDRVKYVKLIGLIRGIDSFAKTFAMSQEPTIIKSSQGSILILQLEPHVYLACGVGLCGDKADFINKQVVKLILQAHSRFTLFNKWSEDVEILKKDLLQFWQGFVDNHNQQQLYTSTPGLSWLNSLNYRGFLGLFPENTFKKSSLTLNPTVEFEVDKFVSDNVVGLVLCDFNKLSSKRYGLIHTKSNQISKTSLIDIYNWVEFYQYHDKLSELSNNTNIFKSNLTTEPNTPEDYGLLQALHPVNITNNLVVSPLNYTMNGVRSLVGSEQVEQHVSETTTTPASWLALPQFMKNFSMRETTNEQDNNSDEEPQSSEPGQYIIGLQEDGNITRKVVYIQQEEYQLIIYAKGDIHIVLIYNDLQQFNGEFYENLKLDLNPILEDVQGGASASLIQTSLTSLRELLYPPQEVDQDFFYVILDCQNHSIQTSLPFLTTTTTTDIENTTSKFQIAMGYLHDQLTNIFLIQKSGLFFTCKEQNNLNEYVHKFTSNKLNDWMFYYIHKNNKFIIIIKNKNKTSTNHHHVEPVEQSILTRISNGVLDLGFLDSLGDDVKYWLGREVSS
ncbi:hypothetical protein JA1_000238 [Spathaspora sp. JA1]|nr:hypothetical protein JA1_000238 [Spathaspora sp. JA1]